MIDFKWYFYIIDRFLNGNLTFIFKSFFSNHLRKPGFLTFFFYFLLYFFYISLLIIWFFFNSGLLFQFTRFNLMLFSCIFFFSLVGLLNCFDLWLWIFFLVVFIVHIVIFFHFKGLWFFFSWTHWWFLVRILSAYLLLLC